MITLNKISKSYGSRVLFENVTITFNSGNRYGLTGPNGAGKTTLLKMMMGMEDATQGSISLPDKVGILRQNIEDFRHMQLLDAVISLQTRCQAMKHPSGPHISGCLAGKESLCR